MEVTQGLNSTNQTFPNQTMAVTSFTVTDYFISIFFIWIPTLFGSYMYYQVINYLIEKAPNQKTLLDGHYVQLFASWIIIGWFHMLGDIANLTYLSQYELVSNTLGWGLYFSFILFDIYLIIGFGIRFFLIFFPHVIENINDDLILFITRLVINSLTYRCIILSIRLLKYISSTVFLNI